MSEQGTTTRQSSAETWLLCYDIREPRRLQKIYQYVRKHAYPVQYSIWLLECTPTQLQNHLSIVANLIDEGADDVRLYHLTRHCRCWQLGKLKDDQGFDWIESEAYQLLHHEPEHQRPPLIEAEWL